MELNKDIIHMNRIKDRNSFNITIDEDCMLPDSYPDITRKIKDSGYVCVEKIKNQDGKTGISGYLDYSFLYYSGDRYKSYSGRIPFDETVIMADTGAQDMVSCYAMLEDMKISVVNSGKISIRGIISVTLTSECISDTEAATGAAGNNIQTMTDEFSMLRLCCAKRETFRIRETMTTDAGLGNIGEIIWQEMNLTDIRTKCTGEGAELRGTLKVFVIYADEADSEKVYCYSNSCTCSGIIPVSDASDDMILEMNIISMEKSIMTRPDANGENRIFDCEMILTSDMRGYRKENVKILSDIYSPGYEYELISEPVEYQTSAGSTETSCRVTEKYRLNNVEKILNAISEVFVEDVYVNDKGINAEGIVTTEICCYIKESEEPITSVKYAVPFSKTIRQTEETGEDITEIIPGEIHTECNILPDNEIETDITMTLSALTRNNRTGAVVTDVREKPADLKKLKNLPGITGYIVQKGDTLWNIAKKYHTTVENIKKDNKLENDEIYPEMKLIIVKLYCY